MDGLQLIGLGVLVMLLVPIAATDVRSRRIPNVCNLLLGLSGLAVQLLQRPAWPTLGWALLAAFLAAGLFLGLLALMRALKRPLTLGLGDVKFLIAASQWVGFLGVAWVFVAASLLALLAAVAVAPWRGFDIKRQMPFGPALAAALLVIYGVPSVFG